ncbi:MAG: PQQ-binding-like beta-propeller repeat protein [bacterium]|nr:PQQ-binding-like beta-propeller repeat protein [bacterium]
MKRSLSALLSCLLCLAMAGTIVADPEPGTQRDWPHWSGPDRNMTSLGNGVFDQGGFGLETAWTRPLGSAYAGISVVGDSLVTGFSDGESDFLVALDTGSGEEHWRYRIGKTYKGHDGSDDGPLATPTIAGDMVYGLGAWGRLFALRLDSGEQAWAHHVVEDFGAIKPEYGFTTTPTVAGDVLVVETGGENGKSISGFDRASGELRWSTGDDAVGYQSPMVLEIGGREQVLAVTNRNLLGLEPKTGKILWQHQHDEGENNGFSQPVPVGKDGVLLTYWPESVLFRIAKADGGYGAAEVWRSKALRGNYAIPVPYEGHLYGYSGNFLTCVDAATGETVWKSRPPGRGNLVLVDGHLVIQARSGEVVVAEASPEGYREKARIQALERGYYTRPSFAGGKIYVRNLEDIAAIGISDRAPASTSSAVSAAEASASWDLKGELGRAVGEIAAAENKKERIDALMAKHEQFPIVEGEHVHFVFRGEVEDLALAGNLFRDAREHPMHHIEGTDFYFQTVTLPAKSHFVYQYTVFDERIVDSLNPRKMGPEGREQSVVTTAGWESPEHLGEPEGARGRIEKLQWKSEVLDNEREVQVYLPPGYGEGEERYPLLVVNHGDQALLHGGVDRSLDNLIGKSVAPVIVAFVPRADWREYGGSLAAEYAQALEEELIPTLDGSFRTTKERGIVGVGSAGFAAVYAAFKRPGLFDKAAAQSFYKGDLHDDLLALIDEGDKRDLELLFHWSGYDYRDPRRDFDARRDAKELTAKLREKGYEPRILEVDDGVGWGMWQAQTGAILEAFYPLE